MPWRLAIVVCIANAAVHATPFSGPFNLSDGVTSYVVKPTGEGFDLTVRHHVTTHLVRH